MKAKVRVTRIVAERASGEGRAIGHHLPRGVTRSLTYESARRCHKAAPCDEVHVCEMTPRLGAQKRHHPFTRVGYGRPMSSLLDAVRSLASPVLGPRRTS